MDDDEEEREEKDEKETIDLRKFFSENELKAFEDSKKEEIPEEIPDVSIYNVDDPQSFKFAIDKDDLTGVSFGKLLVLTGIGLVALGVVFEMLDRNAPPTGDEEKDEGV